MINATSEVAELSFELMQRTIKFVMNRYGLKNVKFHVITRGEDKIRFDSNFSDLTALKQEVDELEGGSEGIPALHKDLEKAVSAFNSECVRNFKKVMYNTFSLRKTQLLYMYAPDSKLQIY